MPLPAQQQSQQQQQQQQGASQKNGEKPVLDLPRVRLLRALATHAKDKGNKLFKALDYVGAIAAYSPYLTDEMTEGFIRHRGWMQAAADGTPDVNELFNTLGQTLNNRAMCYLKLGNMRAVLRDTATAIHTTCFLSLLVADGEAGPHASRKIRPGAEEIFFKACVRRSNALEATGNSAAATQLIRDVSKLCAQPLAAAVADLNDDRGRLDGMRHPSEESRLACRGKVDWSAVCTARWCKRRAGGKAPPDLKGFGAGHHGGSIYVVGGEVPGRIMAYNSQVYALDLASMIWRVVSPAGPRDAHPPPGHLYFSNVVWRNCICNVVFSKKEVPAIHLFDMSTETWIKRSMAAWPKDVKSFPPAQRGGQLCNFAMAVLGDKLYLHGGYTDRRAFCSLGCLFAYNLVTNVWEVVHNVPKTSQSYPEGRHCHQMWAMSSKLYIMGGRTPSPSGGPDEPMVPEDRYFWSYDVAAGMWCNESSFLNDGGNQHNMPSPRSEFSVATFGGGGGDDDDDESMRSKAVIFGGYTTEIRYQNDSAFLAMDFSYLGDTFLYDAETKTWKYVFADDWPEHRAMGALIAVPGEEVIDLDTRDIVAGANAVATAAARAVSTAAFRGVGSPEQAKANAALTAATEAAVALAALHPDHSVVKKKAKPSKAMEGFRIFALGGYQCNGPPPPAKVPFGSVWELVLGSSVKHVRARCWGCVTFEEGLKLCCGTCEGAVATCGKECQAQVWATGHKHWCSKKE